MKVQLHLTPDGHNAVAKGTPVHSWHFLAAGAYEDGSYPDRTGYTLLAEVDVSATMPPPEVAVHIALAELKRRETETQAEAFRNIVEIQEERAKLLSLTHTTTQATAEAFDDIPY